MKGVWRAEDSWVKQSPLQTLSNVLSGAGRPSLSSLRKGGSVACDLQTSVRQIGAGLTSDSRLDTPLSRRCWGSSRTKVAPNCWDARPAIAGTGEKLYGASMERRGNLAQTVCSALRAGVSSPTPPQDLCLFVLLPPSHCKVSCALCGTPIVL